MVLIVDYLPMPWGMAALGLAIPIYLAHKLRLRPRVMPIPSIRLWRGEVSEPFVNRPWQPIRDRFGLLLQLIALVLLSLALAGLRIPGAATDDTSTLWFLDRSASMLAKTPSGKSRFELALDHIRNRVENGNRHSRYGLAVFDEGVELVLAPGATPGQIVDAIAELTPRRLADDPGIWTTELFLQWESVKAEMAVEVLTGPRSREHIDSISSEIGLVTFGAPIGNNGVLAVDVVPVWGVGASEPDWFAEVSIGQYPAQVDRTTAGDGSTQELPAPRVAIEKLRQATGEFELRDAKLLEGGFGAIPLGKSDAAGVWRVRVASNDLMPDDDYGVFRVAPPPTTRVRVIGAQLTEHRPDRLAPGSESTIKEPTPALTRLLATLGVRVDGTQELLGSVVVFSGTPREGESPSEASESSDDIASGNLTYQPHHWFRGLALEAMKFEEAKTLSLFGADWITLLTVGGLPVCATRANASNGIDLVISGSLLEDELFAQSDTFVTIVSRWHMTNLDAAGVLKSGPTREVADGKGGKSTFNHVLVPRESREVASGQRLVREAKGAAGGGRRTDLHLGTWLVVLAMSIMFWEWIRYLKRHKRLPTMEAAT